MLPEIWGATDICHFGPCFTLLPNYWPWKLKFGQNGKKTLEILSFLHLCTINENHMMYGSWDVVAQRTEFFVILGHFLPFDPHLTTRKIKILILKAWRCYHFTLVYHKWGDHMMYGSWDMERERQNFFSFSPNFCPKNSWGYHHFTQEYQESWSYSILFLRYGAWGM